MSSVGVWSFAMEDLYLVRHLVDTWNDAGSRQGDHGADLVISHPGERSTFIQLKRSGSRAMSSMVHELAHVLVTESPEGSWALAVEMMSSRKFVFRVPTGGSPPSASPFVSFETSNYPSEEAVRLRERVGTYRALLEGTRRSERGTTAPLTLEMIGRVFAWRGFDWVALVMHAVTMLSNYVELAHKRVKLAAALRSMFVPRDPTIRVDNLDSSRQSHRSRAPGRAERAHLVSRELAAV
jgi:hypothetical protein